MRVIVLIVALLAAPLGAATFVSEECAFRFDIPAGYEVASRDPGIKQHCAVTLRPAGKKRPAALLDFDAVTVATASGEFEATAFDANFIRQEDGTWKMVARGEAPAATAVRTAKWRGVRGSSDLGCFGPRGAQPKLCVVHHAALQAPEEEGRILIVKSYAPGAKAIDAIVDTFAFTGAAPPCERRRSPDDDCAAERFALADKDLKKVYERVLASVQGDEAKAKLAEEQKGWLSLRERACEKQRGLAGAVDLCRERHSLQRIEELERR